VWFLHELGRDERGGDIRIEPLEVKLLDRRQTDEAKALVKNVSLIKNESRRLEDYQMVVVPTINDAD